MSTQNNEQIITDINEDLVKALDREHKGFYDKLEGKRKEYFLFLSEADQATLMKGGLDAEEEELMWKYGSTLALNIINKGFGLTERARMIGKLGRASLALALVAGLSGIFTSTYLKNHKIQELMPASVAAPNVQEAKIQINTNQNELIKADNLLTPADFLLSWKGGCSQMGDLSDSFYQSSGKPFCKQAGAVTWIGGYVHMNGSYGDQDQPVFLREEGGKVVNVDFAEGFHNPFNGIESVPLSAVESQIKGTLNKNNKGEKHE